ncbi:MAG: hypothetical protein U1D96_00830 [Eubacteriales bacterium]|nr:flagellar protein FlaG [Bacillota bacterium]MBV1727714.1 flagellar protein FlaG [Desulforudis sp.]MDQ7789257.1 hypothetical protein [Clostridia bacterium]MDZ4042030.1 hypothetical protein [Eubacteriales bacterium]MBU4532776.1 flagellar protein FlaG [Bacillota bacterium]
MKVGAGGLQSLAQFEAVARRAQAGDRPEVMRQALPPSVMRHDLGALVRAVARLNELAQLFNLNIRFKVRRKEKREDGEGHGQGADVYDLLTGKTLRQLEPEEVAELAKLDGRLQNQTGVIIDREL